jgi:hypothetical protein
VEKNVKAFFKVDGARTPKIKARIKMQAAFNQNF